MEVDMKVNTMKAINKALENSIFLILSQLIEVIGFKI